MKKTRFYAALFCAAMLPTTAGLAADACSEGVGIPPFLSSGAKPNLLMVLDNSGSMLDAAYSKTGSFCFDDTYTTSKAYGGYFQGDKWYQWTESPTYPPWQAGTVYAQGTRVYVNGIIWEALGNGTATGSAIDKDTGLAWKRVFTIPKWKNATAYAVNDIVWSGPQLFKAKTAGTSNDPTTANGLNLADDTGVTWEAVDSTWLKGRAYTKGAIVSYKGILYEADSNGTATVPAGKAEALYNDTGVSWKRLNEGSFVETTQAAAQTVCDNATGTKHKHAELCLTINDSKTPKRTTAFAARGNLLNWAMASKFDVEKKILTGGKHDYYDQFLVGEHRGCSGSRLVKQIQLAPVPPATTGGKFLSLGVRGSKHSDSKYYEDRIDSTDDTGRLEVLAVTDNGYSLSTACQDAINKILGDGLNETDAAKLQGTQNAIQACIETFPNANSQMVDMRPTLNHSLQACWQSSINIGHFNNLVQDCYQLYTKQTISNFTPARAYNPIELRPADGGPYLCYGVYDSNINHQNRAGYMGRCWIYQGGGVVTQSCNRLTAAVYGSAGMGEACWKVQGQGVAADSKCQNYRNVLESGVLYVQQCGQTMNANDPCPEASWINKGKWSTDNTICDYPQSPQQVCPPGVTCTYGVWEVATWPNDMSVPAAPGNCLLEAIKDYCADLKVPEVIDPSTATGKTSVTAGIPGLLRDSYLMAFLGGTDPISTMKGVIKQADRPKGVVHNVAQDLRLGVMSFRYVGAKSECDLAGTTSSKLEKYCPKNNRDGAELLAPLEVGDLIKSTSDSTYIGGKRRHVDELAEAVNNIRGTSWTPLAEGLYTALGYYTQNDKFCLNKDAANKCLDFPVCQNFNATTGKCLDVPRVNDPVQYWCQDNHILVITEGESTADISASVAGFTATPATHFVTKLDADNIAGDGDVNPQYCVNGTIAAAPGDLYGGAYMDNMSWWGQHVKPLYRSRYVKDPDGNPIEKQTIYTHVVTTGSLTASGTGECNPATLMTQAAVNGGTNAYYPGENPQQLEDNLYAVLDDILSRSSAGSAASVISSSRSGAGAVYQAVFWPKHEDNATPKKNKVTWVGDVHSLFVSSSGLMYEDTDQDGRLDAGEDSNGNNRLDAGEDQNGNNTLDKGPDKRVIFYFSTLANRTRGCYNTEALLTTGICPEPAKTGELVPPCVAGNDCVEIQDIKYLWSANKRLATLNDVDVMKYRKIYTWNDADNNGRVDAGEQFLLTDLNSAKLTNLNALAAANSRGPVEKDFLTQYDWEIFTGYDRRTDATAADYETEAAYAVRREKASLDALVQWLQGVDSFDNETTDVNSNGRLDRALRSRLFQIDPAQPLLDTWRLGDIIHSTPMVVAKPAEAYHLIYRDPTYKSFVDKWAGRRNMIYFGGNDGMLHAVNGGFYFDNRNQFCCTPELNSDGTCKEPPKDSGCTTKHPVIDKPAQLGDELWAYIPYNLQPHLKCLADRYYAHKYYVDQQPSIFDAQIFPAESACGTAANPTPSDPECIHPGGWGTILVGSMRFGGAPVKADELNGNAADKRLFTSAFFVLDITNPEAAPKLLGEMTQLLNGSGGKTYADLGYTTSSPSLIIMRDGGENNVSSQWHLVMGNGPTDLDGSNDASAAGTGRIAILPFERLSGKLGGWTAGSPTSVTINSDTKGFRIPNAAPTSSDQSGIFLLPGGPSFISDIISVDYNISLSAPDDRGARYRTDAIYFGTVDGAAFEPYPADYLDGLEGQFYWNKGGRLFRLVTKKLGGTEDVNGNTTLDDGEDTNNNGRIDTHEEVASKPSDWPGMWNYTSVSAYHNGPIRQLADLKMPTVGAPSIGYDGFNFWIYAGTGRFYSDKDKTDDGWCLNPSDTTCAEKSKIGYFGLKEPLKDELSSFGDWSMAAMPPSSINFKDNNFMTWGRIEWDVNTQSNSDIPAFTDIPAKPSGQRGLMQTDNIIVANAKLSKYGNSIAYLECYRCVTDIANRSRYVCTPLAEDVCFPTNVKPHVAKTYTVQDPAFPTDPTKTIQKELATFPLLVDYIAGEGFMTVGSKHYNTGLDGWYRDFHDPRERNLGAAALLGGLVTYTTYQPFNDKCMAEGESSLYGVHYQTGTAWTESVFGTFNRDGTVYKDSGEFIMDKMSLGRGLSTTPSMHVGSGDQAAKAFIQTSTGEIIEVNQENLPIKKLKSGRQNWRDRR